MSVWICQCLCPDRHCVLAAAGEADTEAQAVERVRTPLRRDIVGLLKTGAINPWCAICDANRATWRYELRPTAFATMDEAAPALIEAEAQNLATNRVWGDLHKTRPN